MLDSHLFVKYFTLFNFKSKLFYNFAGEKQIIVATAIKF